MLQQEHVIGFHIMGPNAGDILQGFVAAVKCCLTKEQLDAAVSSHPDQPRSVFFHNILKTV